MQLLFTRFADLLVHRGISVFLSPDILYQAIKISEIYRKITPTEEECFIFLNNIF